MKVVHIAFECAPIYKTGGLGDVVGSLPKAHKKLGVDSLVILPGYSFIKPVSHLPGSDVPVIYIKHPLFTEKIKQDKPTQAVGYLLFSFLVLEELKRRRIQVDLLHCHDWHAALVPFFLKNRPDAYFEKTKTLLTLHNIAYQGVFDKQSLETKETEQFIKLFPPRSRKINYLEMGIETANFVSTVSPHHATEIRTGYVNFGLSKLISKKGKRFTGILNGIDPSVWNTSNDTLLYKKYTKNTVVSGKAFNKLKLQKEVGLLPETTIPLFGFVARLSGQKGTDILTPLMEIFPTRRMQLVILGTGDKRFEEELVAASKKYKDWISITLAFDEKLAHRIYAASDFFLIPSHYEPCGLTQMISMAYGGLPVASAVGGLVDSIEDGSTGFLFKTVTEDGLHQAIVRAATIWENPRLYKKMQQFALHEDFSWDQSAKKYIKLYNSVLNDRAK